MIAAIESGWVGRQIHESAYRFQLEVERGERAVVGVNRYQVEEPPPKLFSVDPALEEAQKARLAAVRGARDSARVRKALVALDRAARGSDNLLPPIVDAVRDRASVGEISDTLRTVFGTYDKA